MWGMLGEAAVWQGSQPSTQPAWFEKQRKASVAGRGTRGGWRLSGGLLGRQEVNADGIRFGHHPRTGSATGGL